MVTSRALLNYLYRLRFVLKRLKKCLTKDNAEKREVNVWEVW